MNASTQQEFYSVIIWSVEIIKVPYCDCWLSGLMWDGLVPEVQAHCITVYQKPVRDKTCPLVFSRKCMDGLIHCQVKQIFNFFKFFIQETLIWDSSNQRNDWGETKDELKIFSNNTGGRSPPTYCERYSQWEQGNETHSYGCLCSIPSSLICLEAIVCILHRKKSRVNEAKEGNAVSHKAYVPCVVDWQIISSVLDTHAGNVKLL